jgi:hypothetical protein
MNIIKTIKEMKYIILICIGLGACLYISPTKFELVPTGTAMFEVNLTIEEGLAAYKESQSHEELSKKEFETNINSLIWFLLLLLIPTSGMYLIRNEEQYKITTKESPEKLPEAIDNNKQVTI